MADDDVPWQSEVAVGYFASAKDVGGRAKGVAHVSNIRVIC